MGFVSKLLLNTVKMKCHVAITFVVLVGIVVTCDAYDMFPTRDSSKAMDSETRACYENYIKDVLHYEYGKNARDFQLDWTPKHVMIPLELCQRLKSSLENKRKKRSFGLNFDIFPSRKWPTTILYKQNDASFTTTERENLNKARAVISEHSCIAFERRDYDTPLTDIHLEFVKDTTSCTSWIGTLPKGPNDIVKAQPIYLTEFCIEFYYETVHQILHALGFWHEFQRQDRETYVNVTMANLPQAEVGNFRRFTEKEIQLVDTHDTVFDWASIMNLDPLQYSVNQLPTTRPQPQFSLYEKTLGQRVELSFYDVQGLNSAYCSEVCTSPTSRPCQNGGYQNVKKCNECICPSGFGGAFCEAYEGNAGSDCGPQRLEATGKWQSLFSPGYNANGNPPCAANGKGSYPNKQACTYLVSASDGNTVEVQFKGDFGVYSKSSSSCSSHWVEVRTETDKTATGPRFCGTDTPQAALLSQDEMAMILFRSNWTEDDCTKRRGFEIIYRERGACDGVDCNDGTCRGGVCTCPTGYSGSRCEITPDPCNSFPCLNGGTCQRDNGNFVCTCRAFYSGSTCQVYDNPCEPQPCLNSGVCSPSATGDYSCSCPTGYGGQRCQTVIDFCSPINPCLNGGTCTGKLGGFDCSCRFGYSGVRCEIVVNLCSPNNPCKNGANCIPQAGSFTCSCVNGFSGTLCETPPDPCKSNPCAQGTCLQVPGGGYRCSCSPQWTGQNCNVFINPCNSSPCVRGVCSHEGSGFRCTCPPGYTGSLCQTEINPCLSSPCGLGTCQNSGNGQFTCICPPGYSGSTCTEANPCDPNPCLNAGTCQRLDPPTTYRCQCRAGFVGTNCQQVLNPCESNPCRNGATCINQNDGKYRCNCTPGWNGVMCATPSCNINPCLNGGTCFPIGTSFIYCNCLSGYFGSRCEELNLCEPNPCPRNAVCNPTKNGWLCDDKCYPEPCQNGGVCSNTGDGTSPGYTCSCPEGFTGPRCEDSITPDPCASNPCKNYGTCYTTSPFTFQCQCRPPFSGPTCDTTDPCRVNQCYNGGTCTATPGGGGYTCQCTEGQSGPHCEYGPCFSSPCQNGGICVDKGSSYSCVCSSYYFGDRCELQKQGSTCGACTVRPGETQKPCVDQSQTHSFIVPRTSCRRGWWNRKVCTDYCSVASCPKPFCCPSTTSGDPVELVTLFSSSGASYMCMVTGCRDKVRYYTTHTTHDKCPALRYNKYCKEYDYRNC